MTTTTTFASGLVTKTETRNISPSITLNMDTLVYPNLRLNAGGVFELNMSSLKSEGGELTDSTLTRNRPFFLIRSTNPVLSPGFGYFRREERARTAGLPNVKLVNDEYAGYLGWNPAGGPRSDFQLVRTHTFDGTHTREDITRDFGTLVSNYSHGNFAAYYRGYFLNTNDKVLRLQDQQFAHGARLSDSGALVRKRLLWNATYNVSYQDIRASAGAEGGEIALPLTPFGGMAALSDTPTIAKLTPNTLIVDGNLTASAGIDIGVSSPPENTQARNIGLDFLNPTEVNRFWIWIDRELPFEIANSFAWEIYSSPDNVTWTRETTLSSAPFGPFENRFEIDFPNITARYVKVVTRPLSISVPDSSRFTDIFVTEIQAFLRRPATTVTQRIQQTTHLLNSDVRMRILDAPSVFYEGYFLFNGPSQFGKSTRTLSNGVSVNHTFGPFSAYGRAAHEQGSDPRGERTANLTNATFTIDPIRTLRSSLLFNAQDERVAGRADDRKAILVQNSAQLYEGVDVLFGFGWNFTTEHTGENARGRLLNASATIVPRQHLSLTFSYDDTSTKRSRPSAPDLETGVRRLYAAVAVDPIRTFHLVVGEDIIVTTNERTRTTVDVGANWAPFPDGSLQFVFAHNEAIRALEFGKERSTLGLVRWNLTRRSYVDFSYQKIRSELIFFTTDTRTFSINVRLFA